MIPTLALSYTVFGLFLAAVRLFANPVVASAVFHQGAVLLVLFLFAPLLAGWAIVVGMAASVRASEVRVAQVPPQISVSGHVYDLQTGLVTTIVDPSQPKRAQRPSADAPDTAPAPQPG